MNSFLLGENAFGYDVHKSMFDNKNSTYEGNGKQVLYVSGEMLVM